MAARTTGRPRTARSRKRAARRWSRLDLRRVRVETAAIAAAALTIAALPWLVDVPEVFRVVRRATLRELGLAVFLVAGWILASAMLTILARRRRWSGRLLWRYLAGSFALLFFLWGWLGLNHSDWTVDSVRLREVSLGGEFGARLVSSWWRGLLWLMSGAAAALLLAPRASSRAARLAAEGGRWAWQRRVPHRAARSLASAARWLAGRPFARSPREPELVIGATAGAGAAAGVPGAIDSPSLAIRPRIDPSLPFSTIGAGAAAHLRGEPVNIDLQEPEEDGPRPEERDSAPATGDDAEETAGETTQLALELSPTPSGWQLPDIELLNPPEPSTNRKHDNAARAQLIVDTLASFGVDATVVEINEGPTVTQFGIEPGWEVRYKEVPLKDERGKPIIGPDGRPKTERIEVGRTRVRVNRITALQNDLALALAAPSLRIEAPVPGRAIVGIEVPNDSASVVTLRGVMESKEFKTLARKSKLALALGRGVAGTPVVADLAEMPHLLIAGATGSGKSVCLNAIITCLMMNATPDEVRFVMIDPKRVELAAFRGIPHLAFSEIVVDVDKVVGALQAVVSEMEARYKKFAELAVRNIQAYNRHPRVLRKLPYWVVIIDELADLMMAAPFEVEKLLCRLAQLARATGIHLVVATQRPSVDVVTGLIKANFPTRIAFAVTSQVDSRTILDMAGAEKLLGRGDMLYLPRDAAKPIRLQGVYVSDAEIERVVAFWKDERFAELVPERADKLLEEALIQRNAGDADLDVAEDDPYLEQARDLAAQHRRISPSMLQRRLNIGYVKAAQIIERLEQEGIVGPREEGESRRVLIHEEGGW